MIEHRWRFVRWRKDTYIQIACGVGKYLSELRGISPEDAAAIDMLYEVYDIPDKVDKENIVQVPVHRWRSKHGATVPNC